MDEILYINKQNATAQLQWENLRSQAEKGLSMPPKEAVKWYKNLVHYDNPYAQFELGKCYENGYGIRKNRKTAIVCYGNAEALAWNMREKYPDTAFSEAEKRIEKVVQNMDNDLDSYEKYEEKEFELYKNLAETGDAEFQNKLGDCYWRGSWVEEDYDEAFYWFYKSAKQGCSEGQCSLAACYRYGTGVEKDIQKAIYWYKKSAEQGSFFAPKCLAEIYYDGKDIEKNYQEAVKWYRRSAEQTFRRIEMMEL